MARRSDAGVLVGVAAAGAAVLAAQMVVGYQQAAGHRDGTSPVWLISFVGLPLAAFVGASAAPHRVRAVVVAALAVNVAMYVAFKGMTLIHLGSVGRRILVGQLVLVALTTLAARAGSRRAAPTAHDHAEGVRA